MELYRNGLKLTATKGLDESRGSVNVPVKLSHNPKDEYLNYTEQIHIRYLFDNQVKEEILPANDNGFYIPGKPLSHDGPIELAVHLINGNVELVTNELSFVVKNAPNGTTHVDPSEFTWQQLVDQYVNAKLDTFANKSDLSKFEEKVNGSVENQNKKITDLQSTTKASLDSQSKTINDFKTEVNTNLNQTTSTQNSKITTLESRMDTFTSLKEGSTTGDAELQDIRVGADGTKYPSAGESVREQVGKLKEDLDGLYYGGEEYLLDVENANYTSDLNDSLWGIDYLFKKGYIEKIKFNPTSRENVTGDAIIIITDANKKILRKIKNTGISNEIDINYNADVDFYVFVSCNGVKYGRTNRVIGYFNLPRKDTSEKNECDILFNSWSGEDNYIFDYSVVMSDYERYIKYTEYEKIYTLQDAYTSWLNNQKFPIVVLGDSTSIGANTTNYKPNVLGDYIVNDHAYPYLLQKLLQNLTGNNNIRIYNSAFSGKDAKWCLANLDELVFNHAGYYDAKIAFISFGINDYVYTKEKYETYISNLSKIVERLYIHGIQPVILSTQAGFENNQRYGYKIMSLVDKANEEVAKKYNLDFIDKNAYTRWFNMYSNRGMNIICSDSCHYGDYGHQFEAGFLFRELIPQVIMIGRGTYKVGFQTEQIKTDLVYSSFNIDSWEVSNVDPLTNNGFKLVSNNATNKKQMDFYVFIFDNAPKRLIFYCSQVNGQTVTLEQSLGTNTVNITSTEQILANNLDLGLWHVTVNGGSGTLGFKFVDNN